MLQQGRKFTADNLKCLEKKLLGSIYYRMKALGNLGEDLRKWEFTLDWVLSESGGSCVTILVSLFNRVGRLGGG